MASELPDALEKLALKAERNENEQESSLSKYFGQPDNADNIFDTIVKPERLEDPEEPKVDFLRSPASTPVKEDSRRDSHPPTIAFKKGEEDEPKIFSYFSQTAATSESNKNSDATEFFDQISQLASKSHEPIEISSSGFCTTPHPTVAIAATSTDSSASIQQTPVINQPIGDADTNNLSADKTSEISGIHIPTPVGTSNLQGIVNNVSQIGTRQLFTPRTVTTTLSNEPPQATLVTWSIAEERASKWWIPNETTRRWLESPASVPALNLKLSQPGLLNNTELSDPMKELLRHFDGEAAAAARQPLTADMVTPDDQGIRELIQAGCYRAAANLCGRLLTAYGQGYGKVGQPSKHTPHTLQLWLTRFALFKKLSLFEMAVNEMAAFNDLDSPDFYYEYYPEMSSSKNSGTMVPFSLRLLTAELPAHHNRINEAHAKLCRLLSTVRRILRDVDKFASVEDLKDDERKEAVNLWSRREASVIQSLINASLMKKDYHNVVQLIRKQIHRSTSAERYSTLGRVYLQIGDVHQAQQAFNTAADLRDINNPEDAISSLMDAGLVAVAQNAFKEALSYFHQALALDPDNPVLVNNTAVCMLYVGRMRDGMLLLEENLGTKPDVMIRDETVLNVCTLYELESSLTAQRKLGMLRLASQWRNDNLNVTKFKLQAP